MIQELIQLLQAATGKDVFPLSFPPQKKRIPSDKVFITYQLIGGEASYTHSGSTTNRQKVVSVTVHGKLYGRLEQTMQKIDNHLSGYRYRGDKGITLITIDGYSPDQHNQESTLYQKSIDLRIYYRE